MLRELDWVVMKCLEKSRDRRYETANALARDVQRYLADEPVEARPPSAGYRASKFVRRHKGPVIAAGLVTLALVGGVIGTTYGLVRARQAAEAERMARLDAQNAAEAERLAKLDAESRRAEAEKQKARAETREQQAIDAVKRFRDAVADNPLLKNSPELEDLRKTLLKEPLAFFKTLREQLQADNDTRPEALARLADAAYDYAHLTDEIGNPEDGLKAHEECRAIWIGLTRADPSNSDYEAGLATIENCRGNFLSKMGNVTGARRAYDAAREIQERLARDHPAVTAYAQVLATTQNNLGLLLADTGDPAGARRAYDAAREIQERLAREHPEMRDVANALGGTLHNMALLDLNARRWLPARALLKQAITWQKKALAANPRNPQYRQFLSGHLTNLIQAADALGNDAEVADARRELAELAASDPARAVLETRLAAVIGGESPRDNAERLALAQRAYDTQRYALAARLWGEALENDATLADDRQRQHRYNAACAAALAAASSPLPPGEGQGAEPPPTDAEHAAFRNQALAWLQAELAAWTNIVETNAPPGRSFVVQTLAHWTRDPDFASVRDAAIDALPEPEREPWRALWSRVDALRDRAALPAPDAP
jgi:hypothetical protein